MSIRAIDYVTEDFYESLSFQDGEQPDLGTIRSLFHGNGVLINNSFGKPVTFSIKTFTEAIEIQVNEGKLTQFMQRELYSQTEVFGKVAQRISVYEYNFSDTDNSKSPRGINYIQYVQVDDIWLITSMAWCDESDNNKIPGEWVR